MNKQVVTIIDAPKIVLTETENAGDVLPNFFRALGWNGEDIVDPSKVRTTKAIFNKLYDTIFEKAPDTIGVGMLMVNQGPGTDDFIPPGKVFLYDGWISPAESKEGGIDNGV